MNQSKNEKKTKELKLRVTPAHFEIIKENADKAGQTVNAYLTQKALNAPISSISPEKKVMICRRLDQMTAENPDRSSVTEGCLEIYNMIQED